MIKNFIQDSEIGVFQFNLFRKHTTYYTWIYPQYRQYIIVQPKKYTSYTIYYNIYSIVVMHIREMKDDAKLILLGNVLIFNENKNI